MSGEQLTFDYIIAGGGNCGSVLASRLSQALPNASIALIEAGPDAHNDPLVKDCRCAPQLHATALHWNYETVPQPHLAGRKMNASGGRMLSGSTGVNYGTWVRGHEADFDEWAAKVHDDRWSYKSLLPYFKRTETHYLPRDKTPNPDEHGFDGPIKMESGTTFAFGNILRNAYAQAGTTAIADANSGQPLGLAYRTYNWRNGMREPAAQMYDLSGVHIMTDTLVHRVLLDSTSRATGVQIDNGRTVLARKEVILTLGALRTPSVLMLSGIGPATQLSTLGIPVVADLPVGQNLHDHPAIMLPLRLRNPEKGYALGSAGFPANSLVFGDYVATTPAPTTALLAALKADGVADPEHHPLANQPRAHIETLTNYMGIALPPGTPDPRDGSLITAGVCAFLPTSRGRATLASADPCASPIIDPAYLATEVDRMLLREGVRGVLQVADTEAGRAEIAGPIVPDGYTVSLDASDAELDTYIAAHAMAWYHPAGTAAMGSVVDGDLKVRGVGGLRVADVSILPDPIAAHYQAIAYAIGEKAADLVVGDARDLH